MNTSNLEYIDGLYVQYKANPESIEPQWRHFFEGVDFGSTSTPGLSDKELSVYNLIRAYREMGHEEANLNPLKSSLPSESLQLKNFGLTEKDLDSKFQVGSFIGKKSASLRDIIASLKSIYSGTISLQMGHTDTKAQQWFIKNFETETFKLSSEQKKSAIQSITNAEALEKFVHTRYVGTKRFSVEGGDALLPMMDALLERGSAKGLKEIVIGMAHRGRVNMLVNFMGKGLNYVFGDFNGPLESESVIEDFDNDVKYHHGYTKEKSTANGTVKCTLAYNPSHLETVNPVAMGMAKAFQKRNSDSSGKSVVPVLIHGDAAFAGQGIIQEIFQMSGVEAYNVGGVIHVIIDNQVGFTTTPDKGRCTRYSSDVILGFGVPVIHANGDDAESCIRAMDLALRYRLEFQKDALINIICYRRFGHNEGDEPAYTQPKMYDTIKAHQTLREIYGARLVSEKSLSQADFEKMFNDRMDEIQAAYDETKKNPPKLKNFKFEGSWAGLRKAKPEDFEKSVNTGFNLKKLQEIGSKIVEFPSDFTPHPKLKKLIESRLNGIQGKESIDWGTAELLAYACLLSEGHSVRMTGQDVMRGTFTHRHAGFVDVNTAKTFFPVSQVSQKADVYIRESILSEYGVLGFEYGYSSADPQSLTMWEAQFGDFSNGAQIMIDQYICSAETKWQKMSGLVMLLPHGYEGQGPEHSSARLERYLQLCAQYNMQVIHPTTSAQIFHALRRQVRRDFRKPLIVMSPKKLLRYPSAGSTIEELANGKFQEIIADSKIDVKKVTRAIFVSGKFYYDLAEEREKNKMDHIAIIRVEQIYPFPEKQVQDLLKSFVNLKQVLWAQEEPKNMGAFQYVYFRFVEIMLGANIKANFTYVGRPDRASPATGVNHRHNLEQAEIVANAFKG